MQSKTTTVETIWVGMTVDQKKDLIGACKELDFSVNSELVMHDDHIQVLNDLRQTLLNV